MHNGLLHSVKLDTCILQGCGLCHGISGNAYSFLSLYCITKDEVYMEGAQHFGHFMVDHWQELANVPDTPLSLYEVRLFRASCKVPA